MMILWKGLKVTFAFFLILGLLSTSSVFAVLLYAKYTGKESVIFGKGAMPLIVPGETAAPAVQPTPKPEEVKQPASAMIDAPLVRQNPELPAGCEVTSLTMLLQFSGLAKTKMELAAEMPKDETPIVWGAGGSIEYWGHPNTGFVGDVTRKRKGFGIYHAGLFPLLNKYIPSAVDLTGQSFDAYEKQIAAGVPVVVWTTIYYTVPDNWVTWNSPLGPIKTTFSEHAVLLVGYDENAVYLNDPLSGKQKVKVDKAQFLASWEAMGKQGLSYTK